MRQCIDVPVAFDARARHFQIHRLLPRQMDPFTQPPHHRMKPKQRRRHALGHVFGPVRSRNVPQFVPQRGLPHRPVEPLRQQDHRPAPSEHRRATQPAHFPRLYARRLRD
jgi:hypothetical protein